MYPSVLNPSHINHTGRMGFLLRIDAAKKGFIFCDMYRAAFRCCPLPKTQTGPSSMSCSLLCELSSEGRVTELTGAKLYQHSTAAKHSLLALRKPAAREPKRTTRGPRVCSRRLSCQVTSGQPGMTGGGTRKKKERNSKNQRN